MNDPVKHCRSCGSDLTPRGNCSWCHSGKRMQSFMIPKDMLDEMKLQAQRLDRSLSWVVQQAWASARDKMKAFPSVPN